MNAGQVDGPHRRQPLRPDGGFVAEQHVDDLGPGQLAGRSRERAPEPLSHPVGRDPADCPGRAGAQREEPDDGLPAQRSGRLDVRSTASASATSAAQP